MSTAEASDRNNAIVAANTNRCPGCEERGVVWADFGDNPDGTQRLLEVLCLACGWRWPK